MLKIRLLTIAFSVCMLSSFAQLEKIDADRPDQTTGPVIMPKNWMQFEAGFLKQSSKDPNQGRFKDLEFQHPTLLIRYGLAKCFELRLITTYATSRSKEGNTVTDRQNGIETVQLGAKANFLSEKGLRPKISLVAHYDFARLRTLNKDSADGANFCLAMQHTLSEKISIGYNLGMQWGRFGEPPAYMYTFSPAFDISDKWSGYVEVYGFILKNDKPENSIDGGITYYLSPNIELDISSGFGISKPAPDWFIAIGGSIRFKTRK